MTSSHIEVLLMGLRHPHTEDGTGSRHDEDDEVGVDQ